MCVHTVLLLFGTFPDAAASLFFRSDPLIIQLVPSSVTKYRFGCHDKTPASIEVR